VNKLEATMNSKGENEMSDEVKKIYGKITEVKENSIIVDPLFGSKLEIFYDKNVETIKVTEEKVNVEYTDGSEPMFIQIAGQVKVEESPRLIEVESTPEMKIPKGQQRKIRGKIIKSGVSQESKIGSVLIELDNVNLEMLYSRISKGEVPSPGILCTVTILDGKIPKILEITTNNEEELDGPIYTPVPKEKGDVRWPVACMNCGDTNYEELKHREGFWRTSFTREKIAGGPTKSEYTKEFLKSGLSGVAIKAFTEEPLGVPGIQLYLQIDLYQCKNCFHKKNRYTNFMSVDVNPTDLTYILKFNNRKFAKFFFNYNPDRIRAKSSGR